ncbi:MAG: hypothetical protein KatS3mg090_0284 [Patescibacteria group bacterium]|nr:MAG: hypothetical protein KatS3mg090_0284 [Patescibacteria group bacterium]
MSSSWITDRQIESCRVVLARATRKQGKFWLRVFPDTPYTKKPPEVGMGAGKGDVSHYVAPVSPGRILFELDGVDENTAKEVLKVVGTKLPVPVKFVERKE